MSFSRLRLLRMRMTLAVATAEGQQKNKQGLYFDRMNTNLLLVVADRNTTSLVSVGRKRKDNTMMGYGGGKNKATQELPMSKLLLALDMMNTVILQ